MNKQEELYFRALSKDRAESADMLEKPSMRGIKNSVVEKYSDQAHFIYELLQNADDAKATNARFILESDRLIFAHNGIRHFSVTNPADEDRDSDEGTLGDINSITSIANSNKTAASIGKFGVGFKAVFQYTSTPHIYDPEFRFKIERFIVPTLVDEDFPGRRPEETLFVFPFDHPERGAKAAYNDISDKLKNLSFPILFLSCIRVIGFEIDGENGLYGKIIKETRKFNDTVAEFICLRKNNGIKHVDENLWLFSRTDDSNHRYSVGFFVDQEGNLRPINEPAFCFFPTKEVTGLRFIIHAPFLLTDSREGIRAGYSYNDRMLQKLADLSADAMIYLRDIGEESNKRLIDDNIVNIIPIDREQFSDPADKRKVSFLPFYESIQKVFASEKLLPSTDGYISAKNAYWASVIQIPQLFSNDHLRDIVENKEAKWVFVSFGREETQKRNNKALFNYLDALSRTNINEDIIIGGRSKGYAYNSALGIRQSLESIKGISAEFIEKQSIDWLHSFYKWLSETKHRTEIIADKPIFLDQDGKAAAAFDSNGQLILFLPVNDIEGYRVVHPELLKNPDTKRFIELIGVKQPSLKDQIYNIILPMYHDGKAINTAPHFMMFFNYFCKCANDEVDEFIGLIKKCKFLNYYDAKDGKTYRGAASSLYLPTPELLAYFETKKSVHFIGLDKYKEMVGASQEKQLIVFLKKLGAKQEISVLTKEIDYNNSGRTDLPKPPSTRKWRWNETTLDGCKEIVEHIIENEDKTKSLVLWNSLLRVIEAECNSWDIKNLGDLLYGVCYYFYYSQKSDLFTSSDVIRLKESRWLVDSNGNFVCAHDVTRETLSEQYDTTSETARRLLDFLEIEDKKEPEEDDTYLTDSQKEKIEFANKLRAMGISEDDLEDFQEFKRQKEAQKHAEGQHGLDNPEEDDGSKHNEPEASDDIDDDEDYLGDSEDGDSPQW